MPDVICFEDLDDFGRDLDDPFEELLQDVVHALLESYGTNISAPERSVGLEDALSGASDPGLRHRIETKLTEDPRIDAASAKLTDEGAGVTRIDILLQVNGDELGVAFTIDDAGNITRQ